MANRFTKKAMETTGTSYLQMGKEKIKTEDLVGKELTVIGFDFSASYKKADDGKYYPQVDPETGEVSTYAIVIFKEMPNKYAGMGTIFTQVCRAWASDFGSVREASDALAAEGGVKVRFFSGKTQDGRNVTNVCILE